MNKPMLYKGLIGVFVVSFAAFIYLMNVGIEERHDMKSDIKALGDLHKESEIEKTELKNEIHVLTQENDSLKNEIGHEAPTQVTAEKPAGLNKYTVRVYSNTPNAQVIKEIDDYIYAEGYNAALGVNYLTLPSWSNRKPGVYYHSEETKYLAKIIALDIEEFTGIQFHVKKGSSENANSGEKNRTIFIHYSKAQ